MSTAPDTGPDAGRATNGAVTTLPGGITVAEAAGRAGISRAAARKRLRRGSWRAWKLDGEWRVDPASVVDEAGPGAAPPAGRPAGGAAAPDTGRAVGSTTAPDAALPAGGAAGPDTGRPAAPDATDGPLLDALRDEVVYLRRKLDERDEELRRQTITIAQLVARLPQLPAPAGGSTDGQASVAPEPESSAPPAPPSTGRSWWQRLLWG